MRSYLLPCMLSIFSFHSLSAQEANKYTGLFTNKDIALTISVKKSGEKYEGYFEVQKQRCAFTGKMELGVLSASYSYEGKTVPPATPSQVEAGSYSLHKDPQSFYPLPAKLHLVPF